MGSKRASKRASRKAWGVAVALVVSLTAAVAVAQDEAARAVQAYRQANELAAKGALTRSIPLYEEAMKLDPDIDSLAYFNLGEVYRAKGKCKKAAFFYAIYLTRGGDGEALNQATQAIAECRGEATWPKLSVRVEPQDRVAVTLDGYRLSQGKPVEGFELPPGTYEVAMSAVDHVPARQEVSLEAGEAEEITRELEAMTFHGNLRVEANVEGATLRVFEGPSDQTEVAHTVALPQEEPVRLTEGRHFIEVTKEGYHRWIRNVQVLRDDEIVVDVTLQKALPKAIRR